MDKEIIQQYLINDSSINLNELNKIKEICDKYPYFEIPRILILKTQRRLKRPDFYENLKKSIIYISNKEYLYNHINSIEYLNQNGTIDVPEQKPGPVKEIQKPDKELPVEKIIKTEKIKNPKKKNLLKNPVLNKDINIINEAFKDDLFELEADLKEKDKNNQNLKKVQKNNSEPKNENQQDLIEAFIKAQPRITPKEVNSNEIIDISGKSVIENEDFMTETLAKVYIKQGYYSKAMFIYEKLCLKYPEKNTYFAAQIEKIKKLSNKL